MWNKKELPDKCKESIILPIYKKGDKTDFSNYREISLLLTCIKFYPTSYSQGQFHIKRILLVIISVHYEVTIQLIII